MYRHQFQKWGWRKYKSSNKPRRTNAQPPGAASSSIRQAATEISFPVPMLHDNDTTRHSSIIMSVMRRYMFGDAETTPRWMTTLAHVDPFGSDVTHGNQMHFSLLSAIEAFRTSETARGGKFLRRTFRMLDQTISGAGSGSSSTASLSQYQTFELCGSYPHLLVSSRRTDLAVIWLRYVAARVRVVCAAHPLAVLAAHMLHVIQLEQCEEWLGRFFSMSIEIAEALRGPEYRYHLLFWSRWTQGAALLHLDRGMRDVLEHYGRILREVGKTHAKTHEAFVSLEGALLAFASRFGEYAEQSIAGSLDLLARLRSHYASADVPFGRGWKYAHVKVYLDTYCLLCTLYANAGRMEDTYRVAYEVNQLAISPGIPADLLDAVKTYSVELELRVLDLGGTRDARNMKTTRLGCEYYEKLNEELAADDA